MYCIYTEYLSLIINNNIGVEVLTIDYIGLFHFWRAQNIVLLKFNSSIKVRTKATFILTYVQTTLSCVPEDWKNTENEPWCIRKLHLKIMQLALGLSCMSKLTIINLTNLFTFHYN